MTNSETEAEFWKRMTIRARCGCTGKDCALHGSYVGEDVDRVQQAQVEHIVNENKRLVLLGDRPRWSFENGQITRH